MMTNELVLDEHFQLGGLAALDFLALLVAEAEIETFSRADVLELLAEAKTLESLFEPAVVAEYERQKTLHAIPMVQTAGVS